MKIGILTIGNELISGKTQDTNGSFIARELNRRGWLVAGMLSVGDDPEVIKGGLAYLLSLADGLIITGGLGPTVDDITTAAVARAFSLELIMDETVLRYIKERMTSRNRPWIPNNAKQALFPAGAETIINRVGTAWGFFLKQNGKFVAVIPGVPSEAQKMLVEGVIPLFQQQCQDDVHLLTRIIRLSGISESLVDQALADVECTGVSVGFYPRFPELELVLNARDASREKAMENLNRVEREVVKRLSEHIFAYDQETLEGVVAALLTKQKKTIALAESCTGGLISARLTDVPGSSAFFDRGLVAYSNGSKEELLGVPAAVIRQYGAVSRETAICMAEGARKEGKTDLGIATTGIAGPAGGTAEKPVGTVFIALADGEKTYCRHFTFPWDRHNNKVLTAQWALLLLRKYLTGEPVYEQ